MMAVGRARGRRDGGSGTTPGVGATIATGLSADLDTPRAARAAARAARAGLRGLPCELALVFCSGAHLTDPARTIAAVREALEPEALAGCGAAGVLGDGREFEGGTAISIWAAHLGGGTAELFHASLVEQEDAIAIEGVPALEGASALILLPDPHTFPTERVLQELAAAVPAVPVLGGLASARTPRDGAALFLDDEVHAEGAIGVRLTGLEVLPCVSQGAAPVGPELTITASDGGVIGELAGRPALERLRDAVGELDKAEREMLDGGLLLGLVIDGGKPDYVQGDFLVRGLVGADPETQSIAVGAIVAPGQVVRLHARDAASADADLRAALALRREALGGRRPAGALVFTCNGRGAGLFGVGDHDAAAVAELFGGAPAAGFFAAGEIGPVGGQSFLHSFTATLAVFA